MTCSFQCCLQTVPSKVGNLFSKFKGLFKKAEGFAPLVEETVAKEATTEAGALAIRKAQAKALAEEAQKVVAARASKTASSSATEAATSAVTDSVAETVTKSISQSEAQTAAKLGRWHHASCMQGSSCYPQLPGTKMAPVRLSPVHAAFCRCWSFGLG